MVKFSIIVPIYNVERYLEECVNSVLQQSFSDYELILVDDGATDNCPALCDAYAAAHEQVQVVHKANGGLSDARNSGLEMATGEYIIFLDGDDYWNDSGALEALAQRIDETHADIVVFGCTDKNMITGHTIISRNNYDVAMMENSLYEEALCGLLHTKMIPGGATVFAAKRAIIESQHIRFKVGIHGEDYDFVLSVFLHATSVNALNLPFYLYRKGREGSITATPSMKAIEGILYTVKKWLLICDGMAESELKKELLNYVAFIYTTGFIHSARMEKTQRRQALDLLQPYLYVLQYGYWRKTKLTRLGIRLLGLPLFCTLALQIFNKTHKAI